jgi:hypothetical protein
MTSGSIEYAYARLAARYGQRLDETQWHGIESPRALDALLDAVRATSLQRWAVGLTRQSDPHAIDATLREQWRAQVDEIARWMPEQWHAAIAWWGTLPDLPVVAHLATGGRAPAWVLADSRYRPLIESDSRERHPFAAIVLPSGDANAIVGAWYREWKRRLPREDAGPLSRLERVVSAHLARFRALPPGDGSAARRELKAELAALFRQAIVTPAAAFVYLALALLDLERLRGELMRRAAFPGLPLAP